VGWVVRIRLPSTSESSDLEYWFGPFPSINWMRRAGQASCVVAVSIFVDFAWEALGLLPQQGESRRTKEDR
jgi:hypothetical protein